MQVRFLSTSSRHFSSLVDGTPYPRFLSHRSHLRQWSRQLIWLCYLCRGRNYHLRGRHGIHLPVYRSSACHCHRLPLRRGSDPHLDPTRKQRRFSRGFALLAGHGTRRLNIVPVHINEFSSPQLRAASLRIAYQFGNSISSPLPRSLSDFRRTTNSLRREEG